MIRHHRVVLSKMRFCSACGRAVKLKKYENPVMYRMAKNKYCNRECFNRRKELEDE